MLINAANIIALGVTFNVIYAATLKSQTPIYPVLCTVVDSKSQTEDFSWLGRVPKLREWLDERKHEKLEGFKWQIHNRKWESTVDVERTDIEDDNLGLYRPLVAQMGVATANHPDELFWELVNAGNVTPCYDTQNFFDDAHPGPFANDPVGTFDNLVDLTFNRDNLAACITAMKVWQDAKGDPLHVMPTHLAVDPTNEFLAREILNSQNIIVAGLTDTVRGNANVLSSIVQLIVSPWIDEGVWYLFDASQPIRPFAHLDRVKPENVQTMADPTQVNLFERDIISYGVRARYNSGYLFPHLALRSDGVGTEDPQL